MGNRTMLDNPYSSYVDLMGSLQVWCFSLSSQGEETDIKAVFCDKVQAVYHSALDSCLELYFQSFCCLYWVTASTEMCKIQK